ncbi:hypothetical protein Tco_0493670 [Tanacetum coccineum]
MNSIEQCIIERASHEQELKMTLKKLSERQLQIQQCKVQEVQSSVTSSGDETSSGIVSDEEIDKQELEAQLRFHGKDSDRSLDLQKSKFYRYAIGTELEKCKTNLDETNSALGEAISCRDSCLIALQNKQNEFEKFAPEREEAMTLENESRSKLNKDKVKPNDYTTQNIFMKF